MVKLGRTLAAVALVGACVLSCSAGDRARWSVSLDGDGRIGAATTLEDLVRAYGSDVVSPAPGTTVLFPDAPDKRLTIVWRDPERPTAPAEVRIEAVRSVWSVPPGIAIGTTLDQLESMNDGPFTLLGFGGGNGGTVLSWNGGVLEQATSGLGRVVVRLAPDLVDATPDGRRAAGGARALSSDDDAVRALAPRVDEIVVEFR